MRTVLISVIVIIGYASFAYSWYATSSFLNEIASKMHLDSLVSLSPITTVITITKIIGPILAIYIIRYLGLYVSFILSLAFISCAIFTPFSSTYSSFLLSRFFLGLGGSLFAVYVHPIIANHFQGKLKSAMNGSPPVAFNLGTTTAITFAIVWTSMLENWEYTLLIGSFLSICILILAIILFFPYLKKTQFNPNLDFSFIQGIKDPFSLPVALINTGAVSSFTIMMSFYFKLNILNIQYMMIYGTIAGILGILLTPYIKNKLQVLIVCGFFQIVGIAGFSFIQESHLNFIFSIITAIALVFPAASLFSYIHEKKQTNIKELTNTVCVVWSITYAITTLGVTIFSYLVDVFPNHLSYAFIFLLIVNLLYFLNSLYLTIKKY